MAVTSAGVNAMVGTSKPRSSRNAFSSASSTFARERILVVTRRLPVLM